VKIRIGIKYTRPLEISIRKGWQIWKPGHVGSGIRYLEEIMKSLVDYDDLVCPETLPLTYMLCDVSYIYFRVHSQFT
jgi:hypothetical protein